MRCHEDAIARSQEMANHIRDRVTLAGSWWPFYEDTRIDLQAVDDLALLIVGRQRKEKALGD